MNTRLLWAGLLVGLLAGGLVVAPATGQAGDTPADGVTIADGLADASGERTVVVRLADSPGGEITAASHDDPAAAMRAHAAASRSPFERFAAGNPHVTVDRRLWLANAVVVTVDTDRVPLTRLGTVEHVERIHENYRVSINTTTATSAPGSLPAEPATTTGPTATATATTTTADDTRFTNALKLIDVPAAWQRFDTRGGGARVAVLDTGVNPDHPDIDIREENWACFTSDCRSGPHDADGHGTHVSGTVIGGDANDAGLQIGVAPGATLMHAKILDDTGAGTFGRVVDGMQWAVRNDADVISASLGDGGYYDQFIEPVRNAQASGTIVVASIGNSGSGTSSSPGNVYDATAVGSVDVQPGYPDRWNPDLTNDTVSTVSGGERIERDDWQEVPPDDWPASYVVPDVTAPGNIIWSADTNLDTRTVNNVDTTDLTLLSGTSMATPHVAGVVALMESTSKIDRSPGELHNVLETTAVDINQPATRQGAGRVDADAAVAAVAPSPNISATITAAPNRVRVGETLTVGYTATNTGDAAGNTTLDFQINGTSVDTNATGILEPGEQSTGAFRYQPGYNETGKLTATVSSDAGGNNRVITVVKPQVQLTDIQFMPEQVDQTATTHTLNVTVRNVSDDGQPDAFTVALPDHVSISNETVSAVDAAGMSVPVTNATVMNETDLTFVLSPDSEALVRNVTVTTEFDALASN